MQLRRKDYIDKIRKGNDELPKDAGDTPAGSGNWFKYRALAGKVLTLRLQYLNTYPQAEGSFPRPQAYDVVGVAYYIYIYRKKR